MLIREKSSGETKSLGKWWTDFQKNDENLKKSLISSLKEKSQHESFKTFGFSQELR